MGGLELSCIFIIPFNPLKSPTFLEPLAAKILLCRLVEKINISTFTTDRSTAIKSMMRLAVFSGYVFFTSVSDPDSFFTDPDPGFFSQFGSGSGSGSGSRSR